MRPQNLRPAASRQPPRIPRVARARARTGTQCRSLRSHPRSAAASAYGTEATQTLLVTFRALTRNPGIPRFPYHNVPENLQPALTEASHSRSRPLPWGKTREHPKMACTALIPASPAIPARISGQSPAVRPSPKAHGSHRVPRRRDPGGVGAKQLGRPFVATHGKPDRRQPEVQVRPGGWAGGA